jgi:hypothetical protein
MIHQRLYPSRWTSNSLNCQQNGGQIRRTTVARSKHLSSAFNSGHLSDKDLTPKINRCDLNDACERYRIYERRLIDIVPPPPTTTTTNCIDSTKPLEKCPKPQIVIENIEQNSSQTIHLHRTASAPINHLISKQQNKNNSTTEK